MSSWRSRAKSLRPGGANEPGQTRVFEQKSASQESPSRGEAEATDANVDAVLGCSEEEGNAPHGDPVPSAWQPLDPATAFDNAASKQNERENLSKRRARKRVAWFEWLAIAGVVGIVIAFIALRSSGKPIAEEPEPVPERGVPADEVRPSTAKSAKVQSKVPPKSFETRKQEAIDNVLEDAGDGSFAIGGLEPSMESSTEAEIPEMPATNVASPEPRKETKQSSTRAAKFVKPISADKLVLIDRESSGTPEKTAARKELALAMRTPSSFLFKRLYRDAFEEHQAYLAAKKNGDDVEGPLAESILLFEQCLARPIAEVPVEQRLQIMTTLAGLYRSAGRLFDASVYATQVVRSAPVDSPLVAPSTTIAFAVLQESSQTNYSKLHSATALDAMTRLCDLVESRGITHPQLDTMRFATAQMLQQQDLHDRAAINYLRVKKSSKLYGKALLAAGRQLWSEAQWREGNGHPNQLEAIISAADRSLTRALEVFQQDDRATPPLLAGKVALAQIAVRREDFDRSIALLAEPTGVLKDIENGISMPNDFVTVVHEILFQTYSRAGDYTAVQTTLEELEKRYGPNGKDRIAALYKGLTADFLRDLENESVIEEQQVEQLAALMESVLSPQAAPSLEVTLWASETWAGLIEKGANPSVQNDCLENAESLLRTASGRPSLDEPERLSLKVRRIDLLESHDQTERAYELIAEILRETPAILELQIRAANFLTRNAERSGEFTGFETAIEGSEQDAVWGWLKLTNTLVNLHYDSDDKTRYLDRLLRCGYELNRSRLGQADATDSLFQRTQLRKTAEKHLNQMLTTFARSSEEWTAKLRGLQQTADQPDS